MVLILFEEVVEEGFVTKCNLDQKTYMQPVLIFINQAFYKHQNVVHN